MAFGRLTVLRMTVDSPRKCDCVCSCGNATSVDRWSLLKGKTVSCGCRRIEAITRGRTRQLERALIAPGSRFGRLVVIGPGPHANTAKAHPQSVCACDCGETAVIQNRRLRSGGTKSCGCFRRERAAGLMRTHGIHSTGAYKSWSDMMKRCYDPNNISYANYGGRGIRVFERWHDCVAFREDVGERPEGHSLDRIDSIRDYEPGNVRWATRMTQNNNRRGVKRYSVLGEMLTVREMADRSGINHGTISDRLRRGTSPEEAMNP